MEISGRQLTARGVLGIVSAVDGDQWFDVDAAAPYLGFSPKLVYRLIDDGRLHALRFPVRIRRAEVDACLERCRVQPGALAHLDSSSHKRAETNAVVPST